MTTIMTYHFSVSTTNTVTIGTHCHCTQCMWNGSPVCAEKNMKVKQSYCHKMLLFIWIAKQLYMHFWHVPLRMCVIHQHKHTEPLFQLHTEYKNADHEVCGVKKSSSSLPVLRWKSATDNCTGTGVAGSPRRPRGTRGYKDKVNGLTAEMGPITRGHRGDGFNNLRGHRGTVYVHRYARAHTFYCANVHFPLLGVHLKMEEICCLQNLSTDCCFCMDCRPVSYTHLTLPTIYSV